jgi:hypothetical protein
LSQWQVAVMKCCPIETTHCCPIIAMQCCSDALLRSTIDRSGGVRSAGANRVGPHSLRHNELCRFEMCGDSQIRNELIETSPTSHHNPRFWRLGRAVVLFAQTIIFAFTYHIPNFPFSPPMSLLGTTVINSIV